MRHDRRDFLARSVAVSAAFLGWQRTFAGDPPPLVGLGSLIRDPDRLCDLPAGFTYRIISRTGQEMADGFLVPGRPDGMAAFPGPDGRVLLVRNHENDATDRPGPFGGGNERFARIEPAMVFDAGAGAHPGLGGTTTLVYDPATGQVERQFLSLAGTWRNCAGGPTPWGSWITGEETVVTAGFYAKPGLTVEQDHGWCFEVPATAEPALAEPIPLRAMGRFNHEAVAVDRGGDVVYLSEDRSDGLMYRFLPERPGELRAGGRLQALVLRDQAGADTRNWQQAAIAVGSSLAVGWIDLDQVEAPDDDLRQRGHAAGAARFARGEGMWTGEDGIYLACTNGGPRKLGQLWRYVPGADPRGDGRLELFVESLDPERMCMADNLTVAPWGGLLVCEDRGGPVQRILHVDRAGTVVPLANTPSGSEWAGVCFDPAGTTCFANLQGPGLTLAITGPWERLRA